MSKKEKTVLTKTQKRSLFRWFLNGGASLNYERMMSMAYTYSMLPWLKENYKGNPEGLKKSVKTHLQYRCQHGIKRKCNRNFPLASCNMDLKGTGISSI